MKKPVFIWNEEAGVAQCTIYDKNNYAYEGMATCHLDDFDMKSEKTGCEIALRKASIKYQQALLKTYKDQLNALNQLYYSIKHSKKFNEKSYEAIMLYRQLRLKTEDIEACKEAITHLKRDLNEYIAAKDALYVILRKRRKLEKQHQERLI